MLGLFDCNDFAVRLLELRRLLLGVVVVEEQFRTGLDISRGKQRYAADGIAEQIPWDAVDMFVVGIVDEAQLVAHVRSVDFLFYALSAVYRASERTQDLLKFRRNRYIVFW